MVTVAPRFCSIAALVDGTSPPSGSLRRASPAMPHVKIAARHGTLEWEWAQSMVGREMETTAGRVLVVGVEEPEAMAVVVPGDVGRAGPAEEPR